MRSSTDLITNHQLPIASVKRGFIFKLREKRSLKGFTLIELLLYMGLVALFMTTTVYFAWDIVLGSVKAGVHQEVQENLRSAAHRIQFEIRNADSINTVSPILSLTAPSPNNPTEFRLSNGTLEIKQGSGSWTPITSSAVEVTNLTFTDLTDTSSENIRFVLTIRHKNPSGKSEWEKEATFETSVQIRSNQ